MGYISIQINKAKGSADTGASDNIERKSIPKNADTTRTHLNRELVKFPDGVADRTEAISHRIPTAGIRRKITPDQVSTIRIVLSGTHEDMINEELVRHIKTMEREHREEHTRFNEYMDKIRRYFPYVEKLLPLIDFCRNTLNFS